MGMTADLSLETMQVRGQWSNTERAGGGNVDLTRSLYSATSFKNTGAAGEGFSTKGNLKITVSRPAFQEMIEEVFGQKE